MKPKTMHEYLGFLLTSQCQFASSELYWMKNEVLAISLQEFSRTLSLVGYLLNFEVEEWSFGILNCLLELFPVLNAPGQLILFQVPTAIYALPTLGVLCDVDSFWVIYPYSFYWTGKVMNNIFQPFYVR